MDPLIRPNWHVAFIHLPIGLLVVGSVLELLCAFWRRSQLRTAGQFMILIGALLGVPAALSGIHAMYDVAAAGVEPGLYWFETVQASALGESAWLMLTRHLCLMSAAIGLYLLVALSYLASSDPGRRKWYPVRWVLLATALATLTVGGYYGGEAVHTQRITAKALTASLDDAPATDGTAVSEGVPPRDSVVTIEPQPSTGPSTRPVFALPPSLKYLQDGEWWYGWALRVAPPLELHIILAGSAYSLCLLGLSLAFRNANVANSTARAVDPKRSELSISRPSVKPPVVPMEAPAKRVLALAFFTVALAASAGWWVLAESSGQYIPIRLWRMVAAGIDDPEFRRRLAHLAGGAIVGIIPLATLLFVWAAPRKRWPLALLTVLLLATAAAQTFLGVLLTYDTPSGPVYQFNAPPEPPPQPLGPIPPEVPSSVQ